MMSGVVDPETLYTKQNCIGTWAVQSPGIKLSNARRWWKFW
jgi:hypothetical protein